MKPLTFILPIVLTLTLCAQEQPAKPVPARGKAEAAVVVEFDGPAILRSRFRTTNLGSMLAAKEAGDLWSSVMKPVYHLAASVGPRRTPADKPPLAPRLPP